VIQVEMDAPMAAAYERLEEDMREALKAHRGNRSVLSIMLNALLLYPDHPYGLGKPYSFETDEDGRRQRFLIANPEDLPEQFAYSKERRLVEEVKKELAEGRRCQVFAVYSQKRDVTSRLERIVRQEGISCAVMRSNIDTAKREAWYERRLKEGVQVFIAHPKLVETGLDLLFAPTIIFHESGYSLHTLRQASRRRSATGRRGPFSPGCNHRKLILSRLPVWNAHKRTLKRVSARLLGSCPPSFGCGRHSLTGVG